EQPSRDTFPRLSVRGEKEGGVDDVRDDLERHLDPIASDRLLQMPRDRERSGGAVVRIASFPYLDDGHRPTWEPGELLGEHERDAAAAGNDRGRHAGSVDVRVDDVGPEAVPAQTAVRADRAPEVEPVRSTRQARPAMEDMVRFDPFGQVRIELLFHRPEAAVASRIRSRQV